MPVTTTVGDLMTEEVLTLGEAQSLGFATGTMKLARIRHLPVVRDGVLVGLVSHRDLLRAASEAAARAAAGEPEERLTAGTLMTTEVRTVAPTLPADEAAMVLLDEKFGCLPVVEDGRLVGIVTEADFLRWAVGVLASANAG